MATNRTKPRDSSVACRSTTLSRLLLILGFITMSVAPGKATTFYIENGTLSDGGTLTGSFDWLPGAQYSAVDITIADGTSGFGTWTDSGAGMATVNGPSFYDDDYLQVLFSPALSSPVQTFTMNGFLWLPNGQNINALAQVTDVTPTPEPDTASTLLLSAFCLVAAATWRGRPRTTRASCRQ